MIDLALQRTGAGLLALTSLWLLACEPNPAEPSAEPAAVAVSGESEREPESLRLSDGGHYRVALRPSVSPIPLGQLHRWVLHVETLEGELFTPSLLTIGGGMPQHQHGFVTEPRVTRNLGEGNFLIEGMKFHMGGEWTLFVQIVGPAGGDAATFIVEVGAG